MTTGGSREPAGSGGALGADGTSAAQEVLALELLVEAHSTLTRLLDGALRDDCGIPLRSLEVLVRIDRSPSGSMTMGSLAESSSLTSGGMTRFVDRLEAEGFVRRVLDLEDRRVTRVELTPHGRDSIVEATRCHLEHLHDHFGSRLEPEDLAGLIRMLRRLTGDAAPA